MRVRIKKAFYYAKQNRNLRPGDVVNVPEDEAGIWLHHGMAMLDKSVDVPQTKGGADGPQEPETKVPATAKRKRGRPKRK